MSIKHELQEYSIQEGKNIQLGQAGYEYLKTIAPALVHTSIGHYIAVTALEDNCTVSFDMGVDAHSDAPSLIIAPLAKGTTIYGHWSRVSVNRENSLGSDTSAIIYKG